MLHRITGNFQTIHAQVNIRGSDSGPVVSVEEPVVLDKALQQGGSLRHGMLVVPGLWPEETAASRAPESLITRVPPNSSIRMESPLS